MFRISIPSATSAFDFVYFGSTNYRAISRPRIQVEDSEDGHGNIAVKPPKLVIFDCDGVLVDSEPLSAEAHKRVYARRGILLTDSVMGSCVGMKQTDIINRIKAATGFALPAEGIAEIWQETEQLMRQGLKPTAGIENVLQSLGGHCCVASSSSPERITISLKLTGLNRFFAADQLFSSAMVKNGKPAPDLFLLAAAKCGTPAANCVVVEDSVYGVQAALAAQMRVLGYVGGSHTTQDHADRLLAAGASCTISSWGEIEEAGW